MRKGLIILASLASATLDGSTHAEEAAQAKPVRDLTVEQALGDGPYRVLTADDMDRLAKPLAMRVKPLQDGDFISWNKALRLSIALNLMAKDGWEFQTLRPRYTEELGGPHNVRIHHKAMYIFRRATPIDASE